MFEKFKTALVAVVEEAGKDAQKRDSKRFAEAMDVIGQAMKNSATAAEFAKALGADGPGELEVMRKDFAQLRADVDAQTEAIRAAARRQVLVPEPGAYVPGTVTPLLRFQDHGMARDFYEHMKAVKLAGEGRGVSKQLTPATGPEGGYTLPLAISDALIMMVQQAGVMERLAGPIPLPAGTLRLLRSLTQAIAYWKAPGVAGVPSTPTLGTVEMSPETQMAHVYVDLEIEVDSALNVANYVASSLVYAHAWETDRVLCVGAGIEADGGITGLLNSDRVTAVLMPGGHITIPSVVYGDFCAMEAAVWEGALDRATWLMNRYAKSVMKGLVNTAGQPYWQPPSTGEPASFMGYPLATSGRMTGTSASGVNVKWLVFGDLVSGLKFGRRGPMVVEWSQAPGWLTLQKVWRSYQRIDASVIGFTAAEIAANAALVNPIATLAMPGA
jgi:HK97 family phage major capsid protein